tara:strand:+ start:116 stop:847 length:732 start_codon:yes stop_codon:yes gene_type:complete
MIFINRLKYIIVILIALTSCGVPKEIMTKITDTPKEMKDFPLDYSIVLPVPTMEQWDSSYDFYNKYLTKEIMMTQLGISYTNNGIHTWWCTPAVRTHTQLDTVTMIKDSKEIIGDWRIISNRKICFIDSAVFADNRIYRSNELFYDEKDADLFLQVTDSKFKLYGTEKDNAEYKIAASKNYSIINGRFLMLYGLSKTAGAMSQIGIDKNGYLIINSYWVEERKIQKQYITYQSIVTQTIFKKQ